MRKRRAGRGKGSGWLAYALALPLACVMIAPFLYMVATALMSEPGSLRHPVPENFAAALVAVPFARFLMSSVIFSLAVVAGQVLTSDHREGEDHAAHQEARERHRHERRGEVFGDRVS